MKIFLSFIIFLSLLIPLSCSPQPQQHKPAEDKLNVVATTTIIADVVHQIGKNYVELTALLPTGIDPHAFSPTPKDAVKLSNTEIVFANGIGLEFFLDSLIESTGGQDKVVYLSDEIAPSDSSGGDKQHHNNVDPHTWTNPKNVARWVEIISEELSRLDPDNREIYRANAKNYLDELDLLDLWIWESVAQIPPSNRELFSDHLLFTHFAEEYGFNLVSAIIPTYSTMAEPSAQELAQLEDQIRELQVKAIFVGFSANPTIAKRVAEDTGTKLVYLYTGSLTPEGGQADSYLNYIRYNVNAITDALK